MNSCIASALWRAMCTTQRLCSMKVIGQFGTSSVKGMLIQIVRLQRTAFQRLDPGLGHLLAQFLVLDPLNLRPQLGDRLAHARALRWQTI